MQPENNHQKALAVIAGLRAKCDAATPGPWTCGGVFSPGTSNETRQVWGPRRDKDHQSGPVVVQPTKRADAEAIAELRTSAPALLDLVEALLEEREAITQALDDPSPGWNVLVSKRDAVTAALAEFAGVEVAR
jgi:hypothetical protein